MVLIKRGKVQGFVLVLGSSSLVRKNDRYVSTRNLKGMAGAQNPTEPIGGAYKEGKVQGFV